MSYELSLKALLDLDTAIKELNSCFSSYLQDTRYAGLLDLNRLKTTEEAAVSVRN